MAGSLSRCAHGAVGAPALVRIDPLVQFAQNGGHGAHGAVRLERGAAGGHFVQHRAKAEDIGPGVHEFPFGLLGRHIGGRAKDGAFQGKSELLVAAGRISRQFGETAGSGNVGTQSRVRESGVTARKGGCAMTSFDD